MNAVAAHVLGNNADGDRGGWCTPKWLATALGPFDLDPCSNPRSHIVQRHPRLAAELSAMAARVAGKSS